MVEGPGVHRVAIAHRRLLLNRIYEASSPNGKFTEGAAAINGWFLSHIEAHGKNIFYFFTQSELDLAALEALPQDVVVVHIHFGMSGSFRTSSFPGPESRPATRLRLVNEKEGIVAHLSANLCKHGDIELYRKRIESLGPDPLRKDADKEVFWESLQMFLVVEVDPCIEEMQFAVELHAEVIYNCCTEDLWRVIVRIPETDVVLNCFAVQ